MADKYGNEIEDAIRESGYSIRKIDEAELLAELAALREAAEEKKSSQQIMDECWETAFGVQSLQSENTKLRKRVAELERQVEHMQPRYELGGECLTEFRKTLSIQEIEHNLYALVWNFDHHEQEADSKSPATPEQEAALDELTRIAQEDGEYD